MKSTKNTAVIIIDFINEIITAGGKLAGKGYAEFDRSHGTVSNVAKLIAWARKSDHLLVFVRVGFSSSYAEHPEQSPLFGAARKFGALTLGTPATEFNEHLAPNSDELVITKSRVSAFYGTNLESVLHANGVTDVLLAGVATDLAVQSAARDAHDRDFAVSVVEDCCAAANDDDHSSSLVVLRKIAKIVNLAELLQ